MEEVTAADGAVSGTLTIGTISTINVMALTERLDKFHRHYPAVNIRLYVGMSEALLEDVRQQKCDMAFVGIWPGDADLLPMSHRQLADEPLVALVAPQHPLAGRERVNLQALAEVPLVDFYSGTGARRQTDRAFQAAGIRRHVSFEIDHIEWLENLRRGLAAGIVPISTAQRLSALVSIPIEDGPRRQVYCIWPQPMSTIAERFCISAASIWRGRGAALAAPLNGYGFAASAAVFTQPSKVAWCALIQPLTWFWMSASEAWPSCMRRFCALMSAIGSFMMANSLAAAGLASAHCLLAAMRIVLTGKP